MNKIMQQTCLLAVLGSLPFHVCMAATAWKINLDKSTITFTAEQNNAPVSGQFKQFQGNIQFDPSDLGNSHVDLSVDMNSVNTSYGAIADTLKTVEWFNAKLFPKAQFTTDKISKTGDKTYQADGKLTIKDKSTPASIQFTLDDFSQDKAKVEGKTTIKRTQFGVGQGEWSDTKEVKDNVEVKFKFELDSLK